MSQSRLPRELRLLPFRGSTVVESGLLTKRQLDSQTWRRLFPDVYVIADMELDHRIWCEAALIYTRRAGAVVSGLSAALLMGVDHLPLGEPPVELTSLRDIRIRSERIVQIRSRLRPVDLATFGRLPMTGPERTIFDLARRLDRNRAVAAIDELLRRRVTTIAEVRSFAFVAPDFRGRRNVADVLALVDPKAESPMESILRLIILDDGLPRPECQVEVFDAAGAFIARLDLAYRRYRIGIEYEGDHHRERATFRRDVTRGNALQAACWTIVRVTAADIHNPAQMLRQLRVLMARASR